MARKKKEKYKESTYQGTPKERKGHFGDVILTLLMVVAFCVLVGAGYMLYGYYQDYKEVDEFYDDLNALSGGEEETEDLAGLEEAVENGQAIGGREVKNVIRDGEILTLPTMRNPIDFDALEAVNDDLVGWLRICALDLSYPVVQGEDNDYYLHNSFEKEYLFAGCLFMHYENKSDFTDKNTIIYGHNMRNGSMFGSLKNFRDENVYNKSKYFWIYTRDIIYQYRIISARVVANTGQAYQTVFRTTKEFQDFLDAAVNGSEVDTSGVTVSTDDHIVTLSTCTGDSSTRFVVQGKLVQMYASR